MRKLIFTCFTFSILSCTENKDNKDGTASIRGNSAIEHPSLAANQNKDWIENFKEFRNAVYKNEKKKVKSFFDFPIMNVNNEIWYLITNDGINTDQVTPFTETDFDKNFKKLFPDEFIKSILKIKSGELRKKGETATMEFREDSNSTYQMFADFDKAESLLTLHLAFKSVITDENGEFLDGGEHSIIYQFTVENNGKLKFNQVRLAG